MALRDRVAPALYDLLGGPMEKKPFIADARRKLVAPAAGRILEVGSGTGFNVRHYPESIADLALTDGMDGMLRRATRRAQKAGRDVTTTKASVESLPFADGSFDTVVASLLLCSVDDQDK